MIPRGKGVLAGSCAIQGLAGFLLDTPQGLE
jgi:hypothetical protein